MKTVVRYTVALLAIGAMCQASFVLADEYYRVPGGFQAASLATNQTAVEQGQPVGDSYCPTPCCPEEACGACCGCNLGCDNCPPWGIVGSVGFDSFKGISDYLFPSNFGVVTGLNAGAPIPGLREYGFGWQTGVSYGVYDFDGRVPFVAGESTTHSQTQTFVTTGFFRKAHDDQRLSFGIVYDWMFNSEWGITGNDPILGQWRGQIEFAFNGCNAIGFWGCQRDLGSVQQVGIGEGALTIDDRAISQANLFWHHKFCLGADSWFWFGVPDHGRLDGDKSLADWTIGVTLQAPLSDRLAVYGNASYLHPSAAAGATGAVEQGYDVSMGIAWYFGGNARSNAVNGKCWTPYLPVANNSTFLVEQNAIGL
jgi:hypothetical protein